MALTQTGLKAAVDGLAAGAAYLSVHSADPGTAGGGEITGGTPAYARKAASWSPTTNGVRTLAASVLFDIPAATSISYFGMWSAATGGSFLGGAQLRDIDGNPATESYAGQGIYQLTSITLTVSGG
jgi:hypothetical protein